MGKGNVSTSSVSRVNGGRKKPLADMLRGLREEWRTAGRLARRSFALRYRNSRFGLVWEFLDPLVLAVIFILLHEYRGIQVRPTGIPYPLFVISGLLMWQSFADGLTTGERSIFSQKPLLSAIQVSPELIVFSNVYLVLFSTAIRLAIAALAVILLIDTSISGLLGFIFLGIFLTLFGCGVGLLLAPFSSVLGDVRFAVRIVTRLGMFLSSVIFPLPTGFPVFSWLRTLNPAAVLIENARSLAASGVTADSLVFVMPYILLSCWVFLLGWYVVHVTLPVVGDQ